MVLQIYENPIQNKQHFEKIYLVNNQNMNQKSSLNSIFSMAVTSRFYDAFTEYINIYIVNRMVKYYENTLDRVFFALADNTRRQILNELKNGYRSAKELAMPFSISLPAITKHLKILESASLLKREVRGRQHYFCLEQESFQSASEWISHFEEFWQGSLEKLDCYLLSQDD